MSRGKKQSMPAASVGVSLAASNQQPARVRQALFAVAAFAVGVAVRIADGNFHPVSIALIVVAMLAVLAAVSDFYGLASRTISHQSFVLLLTAGVVGQAASLLSRPLLPVGGIVDVGAVTTAAGGLVGVAIGAVMCAAAAFLKRGAGAFSAMGVAIMLIAHLISATATLQAAVPPMDVIIFQDFAAAELLETGRPYSMTFPDPSGGTSPHYGPGLQSDGKLLFGFPYPPWSLLSIVPAWLITGDFRLAHALSMTLIGAAIALIRRTPASGLLAGMFLLTPFGPLVLASGWTEPLVALMLAATVVVAVRQPKLTGIPLGLFWAVKQYVPLTAPLMLLLPGTPAVPPLTKTQILIGGRTAGALRLLGTAVITGAVVTLPLALMDFGGFWRSTVALQLQQPFREDALSLLSLLYRMTGQIPPSWPAFVALAGVQALAIWRMPRTAAGYAGATAASLLVFFALSKQAFANYYFLIVAAALLAAAAEEQKSSVQRPKRAAAVSDKSL